MDIITNLCHKFYGDKEWLNYKQPQQMYLVLVFVSISRRPRGGLSMIANNWDSTFMQDSVGNVLIKLSSLCTGLCLLSNQYEELI